MSSSPQETPPQVTLLDNVNIELETKEGFNSSCSLPLPIDPNRLPKTKTSQVEKNPRTLPPLKPLPPRPKMDNTNINASPFPMPILNELDQSGSSELAALSSNNNRSHQDEISMATSSSSKWSPLDKVKSSNKVPVSSQSQSNTKHVLEDSLYHSEWLSNYERCFSAMNRTAESSFPLYRQMSANHLPHLTMMGKSPKTKKSKISPQPAAPGSLESDEAGLLTLPNWLSNLPQWFDTKPAYAPLYFPPTDLSIIEEPRQDYCVMSLESSLDGRPIASSIRNTGWQSVAFDLFRLQKYRLIKWHYADFGTSNIFNPSSRNSITPSLSIAATKDGSSSKSSRTKTMSQSKRNPSFIPASKSNIPGSKPKGQINYLSAQLNQTQQLPQLPCNLPDSSFAANSSNDKKPRPWPDMLFNANTCGVIVPPLTEQFFKREQANLLASQRQLFSLYNSRTKNLGINEMVDWTRARLFKPFELINKPEQTQYYIRCCELHIPELDGEPVFCLLSLHDISLGIKLTEDFAFELNTKEMLFQLDRTLSISSESNLIAPSTSPSLRNSVTLPKSSSSFNINNPSPSHMGLQCVISFNGDIQNIYLVVRISRLFVPPEQREKGWLSGLLTGSSKKSRIPSMLTSIVSASSTNSTSSPSSALSNQIASSSSSIPALLRQPYAWAVAPMTALETYPVRPNSISDNFSTISSNIQVVTISGFVPVKSTPNLESLYVLLLNEKESRKAKTIPGCSLILNTCKIRQDGELAYERFMITPSLHPLLNTISEDQSHAEKDASSSSGDNQGQTSTTEDTDALGINDALHASYASTSPFTLLFDKTCLNIANDGHTNVIKLIQELGPLNRELCLQPISNLYIYPRRFMLKNSMVGTRGGNHIIYVEIRFKATDTNTSEPGFTNWYGSSFCSRFTSSAVTSVMMNDKKYFEFHDELKLQLPTMLTPVHHLLFIFHELEAKKARSTIIGYAVLPLIEQSLVIGKPASMHMNMSMDNVHPSFSNLASSSNNPLSAMSHMGSASGTACMSQNPIGSNSSSYVTTMPTPTNNPLLVDISLVVYNELPNSYLNWLSQKHPGSTEFKKRTFHLSTQLISSLYSAEPILSSFFLSYRKYPNPNHFQYQELIYSIGQLNKLDKLVIFKNFPLIFNLLLTLICQNAQELNFEKLKDYANMVENRAMELMNESKPIRPHRSKVHSTSPSNINAMSNASKGSTTLSISSEKTDQIQEMLSYYGYESSSKHVNKEQFRTALSMVIGKETTKQTRTRSLSNNDPAVKPFVPQKDSTQEGALDNTNASSSARQSKSQFPDGGDNFARLKGTTPSDLKMCYSSRSLVSHPIEAKFPPPPLPESGSLSDIKSNEIVRVAMLAFLQLISKVNSVTPGKYSHYLHAYVAFLFDNALVMQRDSTNPPKYNQEVGEGSPGSEATLNNSTGNLNLSTPSKSTKITKSSTNPTKNIQGPFPFEVLCNQFTWLLLENHSAAKLFDHSWFLFAIIFKSMTLYLHDQGLFSSLSSNRYNLYSKNFMKTLRFMFHVLLSSKSKRGSLDHTMAAAVFLKNLFGIADRGFVMTVINDYLTSTRQDSSSMPLVSINKHALLKILANYEHWVPINFPISFSLNSMRSSKLSEFFETVKQMHHLIGHLIDEVHFYYLINHEEAKGLLSKKDKQVDFSTQQKSTASNQEGSNGDQTSHIEISSRTNFETAEAISLSEVKPNTSSITPMSSHQSNRLKSMDMVTIPQLFIELRREAILVLRYLLSKHELDPRFASPKIQKRIASLYFPFIPKLLIDTTVLTAMDTSECEEWLICFLYTVKYCRRSLLLRWWGLETQRNQVNFWLILETCCQRFEQISLSKQADLIALDVITLILNKYGTSLNSTTTMTYVGNESKGAESSHFNSSLIMKPMDSHDESKILASNTDQDFNSEASPTARIASLLMQPRISKHSHARLSPSLGSDTHMDHSSYIELGLDNTFSTEWQSMKDPAKALNPLSSDKKSKKPISSRSSSNPLKSSSDSKLSSNQNDPTVPSKLVADQPSSSNSVRSTIISTSSTNPPTDYPHPALKKILLLMQTITYKMSNGHSHFNTTAEYSQENYDFMLTPVINEMDESSIQHLFSPMQLLLDRCAPSLLNPSHTELLALLFFNFTSFCTQPRSMVIRIYGASMLYLLLRQTDSILGGDVSHIKIELAIAVSKIIGITKDKRKKIYAPLLQSFHAIQTKAREEFSIQQKMQQENQKSDHLSSSHPKQHPLLLSPNFVSNIDACLSQAIKLIDYTTRINVNVKELEMRQELYLGISCVFEGNPELRVTWIDNLSHFHTENNDLEEAAQCKMAIASLVAQYLMREDKPLAWLMRAKLPPNFASFPFISPNLATSEHLQLSAYVGSTGVAFENNQWHMKYLIGVLREAAALFDRATKYELAIEVFQAINALHTLERKWGDRLVSMREERQLCERLMDVNNQVPRMSPVYFRVGFYGKNWDQLNGKQFIYKKTARFNLSTFKRYIESQYKAKKSETDQLAGEIDKQQMDLDNEEDEGIGDELDIDEIEEKSDQLSRSNRAVPLVLSQTVILQQRSKLTKRDELSEQYDVPRLEISNDQISTCPIEHVAIPKSAPSTRTSSAINSSSMPTSQHELSMNPSRSISKRQMASNPSSTNPKMPQLAFNSMKQDSVLSVLSNQGDMLAELTMRLNNLSDANLQLPSFCIPQQPSNNHSSRNPKLSNTVDVSDQDQDRGLSPEIQKGNLKVIPTTSMERNTTIRPKFQSTAASILASQPFPSSSSNKTKKPIQNLDESSNTDLGGLLILSSNESLSPESLDPSICYVQMTGVTPYFDLLTTQGSQASDIRSDPHFNIDQFLFETPFTLNTGSLSSDDLSCQYKKKTIYRTIHTFPNLQTRLEVVEMKEIILTPIENAIEVIQLQVLRLRAELESVPTRLKSLQQIIQGSVVPMVNPGPLKICQIFLTVEATEQYPAPALRELCTAINNFVTMCGFAIKLNKSLIDEEHAKFQNMVESFYIELKDTVKHSISNVQNQLNKRS